MPPIYINDELIDIEQFNAIYIGEDLVYSSAPFYIKPQVNGYVRVNGTFSNLQYKYGYYGTWTTVSGTSGAIITVTANEKLFLKATSFRGNWTSETEGTASFVVLNSSWSSTSYTIGGNLQSLVNYSSTAGYFPYLFYNQTKLVGFEKDFIFYAKTASDYCYNYMFYGCTGLTKIRKGLLMHFKTLAYGCFRGLFQGCTNLENACDIPPADLAPKCYNGTFYECAKITEAPELPATKLIDDATGFGEYIKMFYGCTSLTKVGPIRLINAGEETFRGMFEGCTSLTSISDFDTVTDAYGKACSGMFVNSGLTSMPELKFTTASYRTFYNMFKGCTSLMTASYFPNITTFTPGNSGLTSTQETFAYMFANCDHLLIPPTFPITTLAGTVAACSYMFQNCTALTLGCTISARIWGPYCFNYMFDGCTSLSGLAGALDIDADTLPQACCYNMFSKTALTAMVSGNYYTKTPGIESFRSMYQDCSQLTTTMPLATADTVLGASCYRAMFERCTSLTVAPELPSLSLGESCYRYMFSGCTGLILPPSLPAADNDGTHTGLAVDCYNNMFKNCTNLTGLPALRALVLPATCYQQMFNGCTSIKMYSSGTYANTFRVPYSGTATSTGTDCVKNMLQGTGGSVTSVWIGYSLLTNNTIVL